MTSRGKEVQSIVIKQSLTHSGPSLVQAGLARRSGDWEEFQRIQTELVGERAIASVQAFGERAQLDVDLQGEANGPSRVYTGKLHAVNSQEAMLAGLPPARVDVGTGNRTNQVLDKAASELATISLPSRPLPEDRLGKKLADEGRLGLHNLKTGVLKRIGIIPTGSMDPMHEQFSDPTQLYDARHNQHVRQTVDRYNRDAFEKAEELVRFAPIVSGVENGKTHNGMNLRVANQLDGRGYVTHLNADTGERLIEVLTGGRKTYMTVAEYSEATQSDWGDY